MIKIFRRTGRVVARAAEDLAAGAGGQAGLVPRAVRVPAGRARRWRAQGGRGAGAIHQGHGVDKDSRVASGQGAQHEAVCGQDSGEL